MARARARASRALLVAAGPRLRYVAAGAGDRVVRDRRGARCWSATYERPDYGRRARSSTAHAGAGDVVIDDTGGPQPRAAQPASTSRCATASDVFRVGAPAERDHPFTSSTRSSRAGDRRAAARWPPRHRIFVRGERLHRRDLRARARPRRAPLPRGYRLDRRRATIPGLVSGTLVRSTPGSPAASSPATTLCAPRRRTSGVRSTGRSARGRGASAARRDEVGDHPELVGAQDLGPAGAQAAQHLLLGDQPLLARVLGDLGHQPPPVGVARVVVPDEHAAAGPARRGPSRPASAARRPGSATWCITATLSTRSKLSSSNGSAVPEAWTASTSGRPRRAARRASRPRGRRPSSGSRPRPGAWRARRCRSRRRGPSPRGQCSTTKRVRLRR